MFIANDSNYTFGQFLDLETVDIKAPVYSKCFTDTEALKGYRFVHDPEETDPEKCVCFSIYSESASAATATAFGKDAVVSDLTSVMFRLDTDVPESHLRDVTYYHVIVPVENIADNTLKYLVIKMTKEVELFPENYPYYELVDTFANAQPTSAEAPSGGGGEGGGGSSDFTAATVTSNDGIRALSGLPVCMTQGNLSAVSCAMRLQPGSYIVPLYKGGCIVSLDLTAGEISGNITLLSGNDYMITGDCTIDNNK